MCVLSYRLSMVLCKRHGHMCLRIYNKKKGKRKVQGVPQSQAAAHPRHEIEEETGKTKQAQIEETFEKH